MMNKVTFLIIGLSLSFLFSSCGAKKSRRSSTSQTETHKRERKPNSRNRTPETKITKKAVVNPTSTKKLNTLEYIDKYSNIAVSQMKEHGIPASITLAQGILESNSGNSELTRNSNNHFGIKCHKNWNGLRTYYDDDTKQECFRVYEESAKSFNDHALFLTQRSRYGDLFKLDERDYKAWAKGLQKAGYATDKKYPQKLINIIEKYELYKFDEKVLGKAISKKIAVVPKEKGSHESVYIVEKGDGLYSISRKFRLKVETLKSINNLKSDTIYPGQKLYLKPVHVQAVSNKPVVQIDSTATDKEVVNIKDDSIPPTSKIDTIPPVSKINTKTTPSIVSPDFHIVKGNETLYQIAYLYDLEVPDIRRWNGIKKDEIRIGQKLFVKNPNSLNSTKPVTNRNTHTVVRGDTLFSLARRYNTTVLELKNLNNLEGNNISVGQVLELK